VSYGEEEDMVVEEGEEGAVAMAVFALRKEPNGSSDDSFRG